MKYMYKIDDNEVSYQGVICFLFEKEKRGNCFFPNRALSKLVTLVFGADL